MRWLPAVLFVLVTSAEPVAAQVVVRGAGESAPPAPQSFMDAVKQADPFKHSAESFRTTNRLDSLRCQSTYVLPDSLALIHHSDGRWISLTTFTERLPGYGLWGDDFVQLAGTDTLRARVVGATCEEVGRYSGSPTVYVERDGYVFGLPPELFFRPFAPSTRDHETLAMLIQPHGALDTAIVHDGCSVASSTACRSIVSVRVYRDSAARADSAQEAEYKRVALADRAERVRIGRKKGWPQRIITEVAEGNVAIGMTADMVRLSWGDPDHVNTTVTKYGSEEQWVYPFNSYVYFRNGRVNAIQH